MSNFRKFGIFSSGFVLRSALFFGFTMLAAVMVLGNRENIKNALVQVDAYDRFTQSIIDQGVEQSKNDPAAIPLEDPQVQEIVKESLSSGSMMAISEDFIDASYDWLEGRTPQLEFTADLRPNKELLATGMANYAVTRLTALQPCAQIPTETNIYKLSCQPQYLDIGEQRKVVYETIMQDETILKNRPLTTADLPKTGNGNTIMKEYAQAPSYFSWFKWSPIILLSIAVIAAIIYIALNKSKRLALRSIAMSLIGTGVILIIAPLIYMYLLPEIGLSLPGAQSADSQTVSAISNDAMEYFYSEFNTALINISIQVAAAGILLLIITKFIKPTPASVYHELERKSGVSSAFDANGIKTGDKISADQVPLQSSEGSKKNNHKKSKVNKELGKM